jgi:hypothetical protein
MDEATFWNGNTYSRYQYGDDIAGIQSIYGTVGRTEYWRSNTSGSSWSSATSIPTSVYMQGLAGVGGHNGSAEVIHTNVSPDGAYMYFSRSAYPLSSSSSWDNESYTLSPKSRRPAAVAANGPTGDTWVAAYSGESPYADDCSGLVIYTRTVDIGLSPTRNELITGRVVSTTGLVGLMRPIRSTMLSLRARVTTASLGLQSKTCIPSADHVVTRGARGSMLLVDGKTANKS